MKPSSVSQVRSGTPTQSRLMNSDIMSPRTTCAHVSWPIYAAQHSAATSKP